MTKPSAVNNQSVEPGDSKPYDIGVTKALKKRSRMIDLFHNKDCDDNQKSDSDSLFDQILPGQLLFAFLNQPEFLATLSDLGRIVTDHGKRIF